MEGYSYRDTMSFTDKDTTRSVYRTDEQLKAKYEVMRRYGVQQETFEQWIIRHLCLTGSETVLDIGCREGRFLLPIARLLKGRGEIVGCDLSEGVMAGIHEVIAAEHLPVHLVVADAEALPFQDEQFDLVMANHMLYHVAIPKALSEVERVLKPAGTFLATTNSQHGMPALGTQLYQRPSQELGIPQAIRGAIAPTFTQLMQAMIDQAGGSLLISKPVGAFICRKGEKGRHRVETIHPTDERHLCKRR